MTKTALIKTWVKMVQDIKKTNSVDSRNFIRLITQKLSEN